MSHGHLPPRLDNVLLHLLTPNSSAPPTKPEGAAQLPRNAWTDIASLRDEAAANKFFVELVNGFAPPDDASQAQAVFNDLIEHEQYDLFVEAFNAYNALREKQLLAPGERAFKATLTLQLPKDWRPSDQTAFLHMLRQVPVERLEVLPPAPLRDDALATQSVPEAACAGVAELLAHGTAELAVRGPLAAPDAVASGMRRSTCKLQLLELGDSSDRVGPTHAERHSYGCLMDGVAHSTTLEKLSFHQPGLVALHAKLAVLTKHGVPVTSVHVTASDIYQDELRLFVKCVKDFKQLTSFSLKSDSMRREILLKDVLAQLEEHKTLYRLELLQPSSVITAGANVAMAAELLNFADTCPALRHVHFQAPPIKFYEVLRMASILENMPHQAVQANEAFALHRSCRLHTLTMGGVVFTPDFMSTFRDMLAENDTVESFNGSGSVMSIETALDFPNVLANHKKIRNCVLPSDPGCYFFEDGKTIFAIDPEFRLLSDPLSTRAEILSGNEAFKDIRSKAHTAPTATQAMLDAKHKAMANEALTQSLGGALQMASRVPSAAFGDIAKHVVPYLWDAEDAKALRERVHLSEVGKAADTNRLHAGGTTPEGVKLVVKQANADAVAKGLDTAPLKVNTVDALHRNVALREAILKDDDVAVQAALDAGARNFGGLNTRDVRSLKVMEALHPNTSNTSNTTASVSATNSTPTTTTTTTSGRSITTTTTNTTPSSSTSQGDTGASKPG